MFTAKKLVPAKTMARCRQVAAKVLAGPIRKLVPTKKDCCRGHRATLGAASFNKDQLDLMGIQSPRKNHT
uniref:Uncharacterized protein n=1 Tax=Aegilops tauschii subsp. strangulata TaxID=200361 RepID=A0A453NXB2_AEGTS